MEEATRLIMVTGMSGAGRSSVLKMLEDKGFFCVDNIPVLFIARMMASIRQEDLGIQNVALGVDVRNGQALSGLSLVLEELRSRKISYEILYLDCSDSVLVKRFKETRRTHPLTGVGRVEKGIWMEREKMEFIKQQADYIIDTSHLLIRDLKAEVERNLFQEGGQKNFLITVLSFGFKYGIPADADLVFDVRFLPNPFYIDQLKPKTGEDQEVYDFVMKQKGAGVFLEKLYDMLAFLIPNYIAEGKNQLVIAIGCTGGKHRSVTLARGIAKRLGELSYGLKLEHRDIEKR